ncbi:50S ribosomal protein L23 [Candidatus Microgenomates bacterium]|nr:50S ribosomal protein L23 [Candidatus Microgenomates bacterium]
MKSNSLILYPVVTEKAAGGEESGRYTFKVAQSANKIEVKKAVEKIFGTKVINVRILNTQSKIKNRGRNKGIVSGYKKAIVTLEKGKTIKIREEKKEDKKKKTKEQKA